MGENAARHHQHVGYKFGFLTIFFLIKTKKTTNLVKGNWSHFKEHQGIPLGNKRLSNLVWLSFFWRK